MNWKSLKDNLPDPDKYKRVLIYTEGSDFNGEQIFDVKTEDLFVHNYECESDQPEICRFATHWMEIILPSSFGFKGQ